MLSNKRGSFWTLLMILAVLTAGCQVSGPPAMETELLTVHHAVSTHTEEVASNGCLYNRPVPSGRQILSMNYGGFARTALVYVPPGYKSGRPTPVVVNLHGSFSTAEGQADMSGMDSTARSDRFIVLYPQGAIAQGPGYDWNVPDEPVWGHQLTLAKLPDDIGFIVHSVHVVEDLLCVNKHMIYATGYSDGARMVSYLGCRAAGTFAAIAPVDGIRFPVDCDSSRLVSVIAFHGTADPVNRYQGHGRSRFWTYSVPEATRLWALHDRCSLNDHLSYPFESSSLTRYSGCQDGNTVELYSIFGEGHQWPDGTRLPPSDTVKLGPQNFTVDANQVMWNFFESHQL